MPRNLLKNGNFEDDWGTEKSHRCLIFPQDTAPYEKDVGNIFTPPGWLTWFRHEEGVWAQPEVRDAWKKHAPRRAHSGEKGTLLFTFGRKHDAGFLQQVQVTPNTRLRLTAWAHAWSNHRDKKMPDKFPHPDDPKWSEGPGYEAGFALEGDVSGDDWRNFTFYVGIDPTGGTNPFADTVVWGRGAHIYNQYAQPPSAEATAQAGTVTVFLRSKTLWPFKHNDAYWDDVELVTVSEEEEETGPAPRRGLPREQYQRTYVLLPPDADAAWALAVVDGAWDEHRYTIGSSADDAGIGDLDKRRVIAVNPEKWPSDLRAFFQEHYPSVEYVPIEAADPQELQKKLQTL